MSAPSRTAPPIPPAVAAAMRAAHEHGQTHAATDLTAAERERLRLGLTEREMQVLALVAEGHGNPEVGRRLYLSTDTVKTHLLKLSRKLGARGRANLVHLAHQRGVLS